jgi:type VI secretion system protein ImpF
MPPPDYDRAVQQSLLDRLIDLEPQNQFEPHLARAESLRRLRASVRRDIEWLLNTIRVTEAPPGLFELNKSLYTFGIPDISSMSLETPQDAQRLLRGLERAISQFEPRLSNVRVTSPEKISRKRMYIEFHIEALLLIDPLPERLSFDTVFEVARGAYKVKDQ